MAENETGAAGSLREYINGDLRKKYAQRVEKIAIPRFNGRLLLRCRTLDPEMRLEMTVAATEASQGERITAKGLIAGATAALLQSCEGAEATFEGTLHELPKLGISLSRFLGAEADCGLAQTDEEAVIEVFGAADDMVEAANKLRALSEGTAVEVEAEIAGNSEAASSWSGSRPLAVAGASQ